MMAEQSRSTTTPTLPRPVLRIEEAAEIAQVSTRQMRRWLNGELPGMPKLNAVRVGSSWRINRASLERYLAGEDAQNGG